MRLQLALEAPNVKRLSRLVVGRGESDPFNRCTTRVTAEIESRQPANHPPITHLHFYTASVGRRHPAYLPDPEVSRPRYTRSVARVALGRAYLLPPLSSGGASLARPLLSFPHPAHRTGHADRPHPALGQDLTPSPTRGRGGAGPGVRAGSARIGARVDSSRPYVALPCAWIVATGATAQPCSCRARDRLCWWCRH